MEWVEKKGDFRIVTTSVLITAALNIVLVNFLGDHNPWPPQLVGLFGFGMACAGWNFPREADAPPLDSRRWGRRAMVLLLLGAASNLVFATTREQVPDLLIGAGIGCAMVYLTEAVRRGRRPLVLRLLELPALVGLGHFWSSLY